MGKGLWLKKDIIIANKHLKRCSPSLLTRGMKIKTIVRCNYTSLKGLKLKRLDTPYAGKHVKTLELWSIVQPKWCECPLRKTIYPITQKFHFQVYAEIKWKHVHTKQLYLEYPKSGNKPAVYHPAHILVETNCGILWYCIHTMQY